MTKKTNNNKIDEIKLITLGDGQVGKTSLIIKFIDNKFSLDYSLTFGFWLKEKTVRLPNNNEVKIAIFDKSGKERIKSASVNEGFLLVYGVISEDSFN